MYVDFDPGNPPGREHPWTIVVANPSEKYIDFKSHSDQIPAVLGDFKPWEQYQAIRTFYDLLAWLNGPDSVFESNDCGLRAPRRDADPPAFIAGAFENNPIVIHGRLTIIFRDLAWNASRPSVDGLKKSIHDGLRDNIPFFPAAVRVGEWSHFFTGIAKEGWAVTLTFWSWGDDEKMAMETLNATFEAFRGCLEWLSNHIKSQQSKA